jgi:hypothetical protein
VGVGFGVGVSPTYFGHVYIYIYIYTYTHTYIYIHDPRRRSITSYGVDRSAKRGATDISMAGFLPELAIAISSSPPSGMRSTSLWLVLPGAPYYYMRARVRVCGVCSAKPTFLRRR